MRFPSPFTLGLAAGKLNPSLQLLLVSIAALLPACASRTGTARTGTNVATAQRFRTLLDRGDYDAARALMAEEPRRWWEVREGDGRPWTVGPATGPWAAWDDHFRSTKQIVEWREEPHAAVAVIRESNDYYRLLERGSMMNEVVYGFDANGKIDGLVIRSAGERPQGRTDEFVAWAKANDPRELESLMPGGEIDPSGDHPARFRRLLNRWRRATEDLPMSPGW